MNQVQENSRPRFVMGQSSFGKMLMLEDQYHDIKRGVWWNPGEFCDVDTALRFGVRIFLFVPDNHLKNYPQHQPFVVGTWTDLQAMIGGGKIHVNDGGNCIINPLQNMLLDRCTPEHDRFLKLCMVSTVDFRMAFGRNRFTSIIPRDLRFQDEV